MLSDGGFSFLCSFGRGKEHVAEGEQGEGGGERWWSGKGGVLVSGKTLVEGGGVT